MQIMTRLWSTAPPSIVTVAALTHAVQSNTFLSSIDIWFTIWKFSRIYWFGWKFRLESKFKWVNLQLNIMIDILLDLHRIKSVSKGFMNGIDVKINFSSNQRPNYRINRQLGDGLDFNRSKVSIVWTERLSPTHPSRLASDTARQTSDANPRLLCKPLIR